jgi:hypothetical protein
MATQLNAALLQQLEALAQKEKRDVNDVLTDAITLYINQSERAAKIKRDTQRIIQRNQQLFDELANR